MKLFSGADFVKTNGLSNIGITNLRDIGGLKTPEGHLKKGIFFRSGELYQLSKAASNFLSQDLAIKKIFDFRRPVEIKNRPDITVANAAYENINLLSSPAQANPSLKNMVINLQMDDYMYSVYTELALSPSARQGFHDFLLEVLALKKPLIFHCFAGKDRTGFAAALLLKIAGVAPADIFDDYLKTNQARKKANQQILERFNDKLSSEKLKALEVSLYVKAEYLQFAFEQIQKNYGTFNHYLKDGLALPADFANKFRIAFIA
jgi:protein-tyrosine phosphatase